LFLSLSTSLDFSFSSFSDKSLFYQANSTVTEQRLIPIACFLAITKNRLLCSVFWETRKLFITQEKGFFIITL